MRNRSEKGNPGSASARESGCFCPTDDNFHGAGRYGDGAKFGWFRTQDCPLHGCAKRGVITCSAVAGTIGCLSLTTADSALEEGWRTVAGEWWCTGCHERYGFRTDEEQPGQADGTKQE
jgi:hypothetical protein